MQAVVKIGSTQHLVTPGQVIEVDKLMSDHGPVAFSEVLLTVDDNHVQIGRPYLPDTQVTGTILGPAKGTKIRVSVYKAKSRYRKTRGFRAALTKIRIDGISLKKAVPTPRLKSPRVKKPS